MQFKLHYNMLHANKHTPKQKRNKANRLLQKLRGIHKYSQEMNYKISDIFFFYETRKFRGCAVQQISREVAMVELKALRNR